MRYASAFVFVAFLGLRALEIGGADQPSCQVFYSSQGAKTVTIQSDNGPVTTMEIPDGVYLNVAYTQRVKTATGAIFQGETTIIRLRRKDEVAADESRISRDIMAKGPLEIVLKNAVVRVERPLSAG